MRPRQFQLNGVGLISRKFQPAVAVLLEAVDYATKTSGKRWEFAVGVRELMRLGLSANDLRFLVRLKYIDHATEVMTAGGTGRQFRAADDLRITRQSCFVLTQLGLDASLGQAAVWEEGGDECPMTIRFCSDVLKGDACSAPRWDSARRTLSWGGMVVKEFKRRAINQEVVLSAFQEDGWPARIDDPLAPQPSMDRKRRLNHTIKCLNHRRIRALIRFRGDGTGQGVVWESAPQVDANG